MTISSEDLRNKFNLFTTPAMHLSRIVGVDKLIYNLVVFDGEGGEGDATLVKIEDGFGAESADAGVVNFNIWQRSLWVGFRGEGVACLISHRAWAGNKNRLR